MGQNLAKFRLPQLCGKHVSSELGYLAEKTSSQNALGPAWFLLAALGECERKDRN